MSDDILQVLLERVDTLQKSLDRIDRDLAKDRRDIQDFTIRVGALESEFSELRNQLNTLVTKVKDKVDDAIEPLAEAIERKTIIKVTKYPWWMFFKKGGKNT